MSLEEFFERLRRRLRKIFEEIEEETESMKPMWTPDGALEPLVSLYEYPDKYEILIDLPYGDLRALSIEVRNNYLIIECQLREEVRFERWGVYSGMRFRRYYASIRLPDDVDIDNMVVERSEIKGIVRIILPRRLIY